MDAIATAQALYLDACNASREQRAQIEEDLAFSDPSDPRQWDERIKRQRENDPGGMRPCLVFDQIGQYVSNVAGQVEQQPPALHALPVDGSADKRVAEQLDGFFRHIEYSSRAQQHYSRALLSAARCGVGYLVVRPEYVERALNWQEPRIVSEGDPLRVVLDPWSVELDGSDANLGFLLSPLSHAEFARRYGKKDKVSFGEDMRRIVDERESVVIAECWRKESVTQNMIVCMLDGDEVALSEDDYWRAMQNGQQCEVRGNYADKQTRVKWSVMSGADMLAPETEYPASGIGIVPVYGYVGWTDGRMRYCGMARRAMNAQRSYNYHMSEMHVFMGQAPKSPYMAAAAALRGYETLWDRASVDSRAYLPYNHVDETGQPVPMPQRVALAVNLQNHMAGAEQALKDIQASLGMYQASLGAPSNETSGVAIENRKQQGEAATANFPAALKASVGQAGKLCMDMIPRLIDKKRQLRIIGIDDTPGQVTIDPQQPEAVVETQSGLVINPNVGRYDVRVVVGASFSTQRAQAQTAFAEIMRAAPQLLPAVAPIWAKTLDIPHADKLAQVLTAIAPPEVKAILQPQSQGPTTADLLAQVQQLQEALQEATALATEAEQELASKDAELDGVKADKAVDQYNAETARLKVTGANEAQIQAIVSDLLNQMLSSPAPIAEAEQQEPQQPFQ
jgi:hypothetical protein